jgi:hypothetical protein
MMTLAEFKAEIWGDLPPIRRMLVGREVVDDLVEIAVHNWEGQMLAQCSSDDERKIVAGNILHSVRRGYQAISGREPEEYGVFFWPILLQAVASLVVHLILQWWLAKRINRVRLEVWKTEMHR